MTIQIGEHEFDEVHYDSDGDVLYLRKGPSRAATTTHATPEGHAVRFDEAGEVIGLTLVNAKWLSDRDGKVAITIPRLVEAQADVLAPALS